MSFKLNTKPTLPVIKQTQFAECGHACIAMIANFYGHQLDLMSLRQIDEPSINGSTLLDLIRLLERLKLNARAIRVDLHDLKHVQCPAIIHWNMNHFVVLHSVKERYAVIHDPAVGKRKVSLQELSTSFTGIVLEVEKGIDFTAIQSINRLSIAQLFKSVHGLKRSLSVLLLLSLAIEILILINPFFLQYTTDHITQSNDLNNLSIVAFGFVLLTLFHSATDYMRGQLLIYLTYRLSDYFSSGIMTHLLKLPFDFFVRRHKGDILSRFHSIREIQSKITNDSITTLLDGLIILLAAIIMFFYSWQLTLLVVMFLVCYVAIRILSFSYLKNQTERSVSEHANVNSKFLEIIQSMMPIKLYSKETTLFREWKNYFINAMNADIKIAKTNSVYQTLTVFLFNCEYILIVSLGACLVTQNQFSIGMLIAFLAYRQMLVSKTSSFVHKLFEYKLASVQVERVNDILMSQPEQENHSLATQHEIKGAIRVENLSYKFPGGQNYLFKDLHFTIHPGEKIVITGPSGIGKTTLLKILLGLTRPCDGSVLIDEINLSLLHPKAYRSACATVMQDDVLLSGSVLDNITFLDPSIDLNKVFTAARIAHIHEDIMRMPMQYETLIGDMGSALSGGQKQRIFLARALYKNPKFLFLDEATSHLDVETEIKINQALKQLAITQIVIAHREETIRMADRVIELGR